MVMVSMKWSHPFKIPYNIFSMTGDHSQPLVIKFHFIYSTVKYCHACTVRSMNT